MAEYTKSGLQSKKVAELREIAEELDLETKGLKKADLVDTILNYYEAQPEQEPEIVEEIKIEDIPEESLKTEPEVEPQVEEIKEVKAEPAKAEFKPIMLHLDTAVNIYKSTKGKEIIGKVKGAVKVVGEEGKFFKIRTFVFGKGSTYAYILKYKDS